MILYTKKHIFLLFLVLGLCKNHVFAQRIYAGNSVLSTGNWYKIGITKQGIYKIDIAFLNSCGINTANIQSASIRLFGNGGAMLNEKNNENRPDDLTENAIEVFDGGDGVFNGNDFILFYGTSTDKWLKDSLNARFQHSKNLFSDTAYYFLNIGQGVGKRITLKNSSATSNTNVNSYNDRFFHESDQINFLNSGKEWFGEEFSSLPGNSLSKSFSINMLGLDLTTPLYLTTSLAARSIGTSSSFTVAVNNLLLPTLNTGAVSGNYLDAFATSIQKSYSLNPASANLNVNFSFSPASSSSQGWLNWFELHGRSNLAMNGANQLFFRDWKSVGAGSIAFFSIDNTSANTIVWDITNEQQPQKLATNFLLGKTTFVNDAFLLREYIAFENTNFLLPTFCSKIDNQNLHNSQQIDYLIVTSHDFINEAKRLALFHTQQYAYKTFVATTEQIYNEFAGGNADPTSIRDFAKMYYDKAGTDSTKRPKYLLLFGAASFDYKNRLSNNTNYVPCYESVNSLDPLLTYTSDDYYALLKDADDVNLTSPPSQMDIAVGRLPVTTVAEAKTIVDKIIKYHASASMGSWRNNTVFTADDKDVNVHLNDAETVSTNAFITNNLFNQNKIYLDAFPLVSGTGGGRYPQVNETIVNQLYAGCLFFNYNGHGGYQRLAEEAILGQEEANQFNNSDKLPLFITATCDFAPYDDPTKASLGASLLVGKSTGAIGLVTTTRVVFAFSNKVLNDNFLKIMLTRTANNDYLTLGDAIKKAKNYTYSTFNDVVNNRKFTLIGDPGIRLAFPKLGMQLTTINNQNISGNDTLKALSKNTFTGKIVDVNGNINTAFNGTVYATLYDKKQTIKTLGNDPASIVTGFDLQQNILYKGKATATNGTFNFSFIVPKDINYQVGTGRLSLYAENGNIDANGVASSFYIGGISNTIIADIDGPGIKAYINNEKFVNGGLVNNKPILLVKLFDSSGINTSGLGIGHDITATIDGSDKSLIVLNNYFEADKDSYQSGTIKFQLPVLTDGLHFIKIKAWDVANNSSEKIIEFMVAQPQNLQISHVINYPNPFTTKTNFWFEHNQQEGGELSVLINIFTVTGKLAHQIRKNIGIVGNRVSEIEWDGKDRYSEKLAKGVYIYRIIVTNSAGMRAEATQKLYLL